MRDWSSYTNVDMNFFEKWSPELAYVVGFFLADGHLSNYDKRKRYSVIFNNTDKDVIEKIAVVCDYKGKIYSIHDKRGGKNGGYKTMYRIDFSGRRVWKFFRRLGFDSNKSQTAYVPIQIPEYLYSHFIRGVFDGDGGIIIKRGVYTIHGTVDIAGTKKVVEFISRAVIHYNVVRFDKKCNVYHITYCGRNAIEFLEFIYKNSKIHMDRKYKVYMEFSNGPRMFTEWIHEEIDFLKTNYNSPMPINDIAAYLGRSYNAVTLKAERIGLRRPCA